MPDAVIVSAARSPIGRAFKGSLRDVRPDDLATTVVQAALAKIPSLDPSTIDDLLLGCGAPGGEQGFNMARVVAVKAGLDSVPAATVTRYCASSLQTTRMAFHAIKAGEGHVFVSAGVESVSRSVVGSSDSPPIGADVDANAWQNPVFATARQRTAERATLGQRWVDPRDAGWLPDVYIEMGQTAENVAQLMGICRREQDEFGVRSQNLAEAAAAAGFWHRDVAPIKTPSGDVVSADDGPRTGVTYQDVAGLKPVFRPDGTVTAGNCCPLNDGAAALVIMSGDRAAQLGLDPLARIVSTGVSALSPEIMGLGPVEASRRALALAGLSMKDMDQVEINEAFAAQVIASYKELEITLDRLNVNGGAIAMGHPFGMTGARITSTLINSLQANGGRFGLEAMCVGGGQGMAMIIELC
jgi:acetyl-CoA C-acetyltransferase